MAIRDGDVALLARQAVDLLDPDLDVRIEPDAMSDPYRLARSGWTVHPLLDVRPTFGIHLVAGMTPAEALARADRRVVRRGDRVVAVLGAGLSHLP